ncbi:MAG: cob(I)yrinic acid a,c-diamide adenosyltransferase [Spirochaetales bacterium]|nr:cob(I)yrinic acid a,c-diamide adenosyltransferase [Spirochaetales bacterium]
MKIYTRSGDDGRTRLASGEAVNKHDLRVELYGLVDELNSAIGLGVSDLEATGESLQMGKALQIEQSLLFELGAELAGYRKIEAAILPEDIERLEKQIDQWSENLADLRQFILPGGTRAAAGLHLSRTICRRLERQLTRSKSEGLEISAIIIIYINRLSDYLFVAARTANRLGGQTDIPWQSARKS